MKTLLAKQQLKPGSDSDNNSQEDKGEPLSKEKLKYLRYFRLVTHRKRNGMYHRSWSPGLIYRIWLTLSTKSKLSKTRRQNIYFLATISLANHYHNMSSKTFILRDRYKRFSSNGLQENVLLRLCVLSEKRTVIIKTVLFWDNTCKLYKRNSGTHYQRISCNVL